MEVTLSFNGKVAVKADFDPTVLKNLFSGSYGPTEVGGSSVALSKSTPMTKAQIVELLSRIDPKSAHFLKQLAANGGAIAWPEVRAIFGIVDKEDWSAFSASYNKGITRAVRNILGDKSARLVWWNERLWHQDEDLCTLHVDGASLQALREAVSA